MNAAGEAAHGAAPNQADDAVLLRAARRRLLVDILGIATSAGAFGVVFGLAARQAGYSLALVDVHGATPRLA